MSIIPEYSRIGNNMLEKLDEYDLTQTEYKVLIHLMRTITPGTININLSHKEIAANKNLDPSVVSKVFKSLAEKNILRKRDRYHWSINPHFFYNGAYKYWERLLASWDKLSL